MGVIGKDFKYKIIKNFLSEDEVKLLRVYCEIKHRSNFNSFDFKQNNAGDTYYYGDPIMDALMINKQKIMEQETGKKLLPTYSFWRVYTKFTLLDKHKDRPSCEISTTVYIGGDTDWPIYMDGTPVHLQAGDAAVYLGCKVSHWRDEFQGDYQLQTFLHYVDADGKNKNYYMDQRNLWGTQK